MAAKRARAGLTLIAGMARSYVGGILRGTPVRHGDLVGAAHGRERARAGLALIAGTARSYGRRHPSRDPVPMVTL